MKFFFIFIFARVAIAGAPGSRGWTGAKGDQGLRGLRGLQGKKMMIMRGHLGEKH